MRYGCYRASKIKATESHVENCLVNTKGKRKVQGMTHSQTAALPRHQEEEETDKTRQAQIEQTYEKH